MAGIIAALSSYTSVIVPTPLMPSARFQRALFTLAWANVALHGLGVAVAWFGMRSGSIAAPLNERMAYIASRPAGWIGGWGLWMICALLLVAFMAVLRGHLPAPDPAADLALALSAAGMGVDLLCDVIQIQVLPLAAAAGPGQITPFLLLERLAFTGGTTVANGLYTISVVLMTVGLRRSTPATRFAGWATGVSGAVMVLSGLVVSPALLLASTGPTIGFFSLWTVLVARDLRQDGR
ncbi:MAG TPA: hypothetical protein VLV54_14165 [Thermoanaerobaculia bacterium]|nr:hypothetical protein [Thermoanaerobaculia bacterium]